MDFAHLLIPFHPNYTLKITNKIIIGFTPKKFDFSQNSKFTANEIQDFCSKCKFTQY